MTFKQLVNRLHGIVPPLATPFNNHGDVDEGAFRSNLQHYTGIGLAGVMVAGTTGEALFLTARERLSLTEIARSNVQPREIVITGTGLESTRATIELSREALAAGADAVLVVTPGYYKSMMNGPALLAHYRAVADALRRPVMIYSIPQCTGVRVPVETIAELARHPNIVGMKESSGDLAYVRAILRRVPPSFHLFSGSLNILPDVVKAGGIGGILSQSNFAPALCVALDEACRQGRRKQARELHARLLPLATEITMKYGPPSVKAAMDLLGYRGGNPRSPLLPATAAARREIARTLKAAQISPAA